MFNPKKLFEILVAVCIGSAILPQINDASWLVIGVLAGYVSFLVLLNILSTGLEASGGKLGLLLASIVSVALFFGFVANTFNNTDTIVWELLKWLWAPGLISIPVAIYLAPGPMVDPAVATAQTEEDVKPAA